MEPQPLLGDTSCYSSRWTSYLKCAILGGGRLVPFQRHHGTHLTTWHEGHPSTYHQMVSYLTEDGHINIFGSQLAARQCYQIARESGSSSGNKPLMEQTDIEQQ
ncbi:hypothetical protein AAG906_009147 [Vitis piasezkii]